MSGSGSIGGSTSVAGTADAGPFQPFTVLPAKALNSALLFGNKLGGNLDNCPIGQTTPAAGSFTTLTAVTAAAGDSSTNVATTAYVQTAVGIGGGGGGGGSVSLNSPSFTGVPTAPTAALGNATTQLATTAFVANALANNMVGSLYTGSGSTPGFYRDDGTGTPSVVTTYFWSPINIASPASNQVFKYRVPNPASITGIYVEAPGAGSAGSNSFALTITRNGNAVGGTYTGSVTSTTVNTISPTVACATGDVLLFTIGTVTGTIPVVYIQLTGNFG